MTDNLSSFNTYTAPAHHVNVLSNGISGQAVDSVASPIEEEEDYTIKCFCGFQLDDGNTVFCDRCETWQHIECYYFGDYRNGLAPDVGSIEHACVDCSPRQYDKKSAAERQRERFLPEERKIKKAPAKPIKKRAKPSESNATLTNGYSHEGCDLSFAHERTSGSPRDHGPPTKRPKTSHRNSGSINLHAGPFASKSQSSRKISKTVTQHPPVTEYFVEPPSPEFLCLYDDDPGDDPEAANVFNDIAITRSLSSWSRDVESLSRAANGLTPPQVFHRLNEPLDLKVMPQLHKEHRVDKSIEIGGRHPQRTSLSTENEMAKESIVGELRGRIGHMSDYCLDTANRWDYLRHPAPFVFFHPKLPIYIDTRQTGSTCRYLRRSCRPNVELRTILENSSDYRFIFIAKENLEAGAELTISWTPDEHIRRCVDQLSNPIKQEGTSDADAAYVSDWVQKVLSNFGGCACESPEQCGLVKWLRSRDLSSMTNGNLSNGKTLKGRNGHAKAISTPEFGNGTNSRASSEGMKRTDDEDGDNSRSVSGSKTPTRYGSGVPSLEISDREKRKIAAAEKTFEQIEQERQQPGQRRKKRSSGGSNLNTPTVATSVRTPSQTQPPYGTNLWDQKQLGQNTPSASQPNTPGLSARPQYTDASTSRKNQGSPVSKHSYTSFKRPNSNSKRSSHPNTPSTKSPPMRQDYVHKSVQTDADESEVWGNSAVLQGHKRKVYISLGKRLLMRCQQDREQVEERRRTSMDHTADSLPIETASEQMRKSTNKTADVESNDRDIEMKETADTVTSSLPDETSTDRPVEKPRPPDEDSNPPESFATEIKPPPPPSIISHTTAMSSSSKLTNGFRSAELRVQLPSAHHQTHDPASAPPVTTTVTPTVARSPFPHTANSYPPLFSSASSGAVAPSPVKKVSLGEYFSRRKTESQISTHGRAAGSSPTISQSTIKGVGHADEEDKLASSETNGVVEIPKEDSEPTMGRKTSAP